MTPASMSAVQVALLMAKRVNFRQPIAILTPYIDCSVTALCHMAAMLQIIAYNKIDVPDSGDYWEFVREYLVDEEGIPAHHVLPLSAVTGRGVREAVAAVREVLDELGPAEVQAETNALNLTSVPRRFNVEVRDGGCA